MEPTITGQGVMKIDGKPMTISFTVPSGTCAAEALLPDLHRVGDQITDHASAKAKQEGLEISCGKGCGACCRQMAPVSPAEARQVAALVEQMPAERAAVVKQRFVAARDRLAAAGIIPEGNPDHDKAAYRAYGLAYFGQGVPCPFLEAESCSIYPDRPLVCREYLVTSPPAACAQLGSGKVRQVPIPLRVWAAFSRSNTPERQLEWLPLTDALHFAGTSPVPAADLTGPQRVQAFLEEVQK